jgi:hypothetical protein
VKQPAAVSVNAQGEPIDPTANVIALVQAKSESDEALRNADIKYNDAVTAHLKEIGALRAKHAEETRAYDSDRYDKIRSVDMANAAATASQILQAVQTNPASGSPIFDETRFLADGVRRGLILDRVQGADYYYAPRAMSPPGAAPAWATKNGVVIPPLVIVGSQHFYQLGPDGVL